MLAFLFANFTEPKQYRNIRLKGIVMLSDTKYLTPYIMGVFFSVCVLMLYYFSCLAIEQSLIPKYWQLILQFLTTLVATCIGAYLAFEYRVREKTLEITEKQVESLNNAIIALARQRSVLRGIQRKVEGNSEIEELKSEARIALGQEQILINSELRMPQWGVAYVNINSLTFLIKNRNEELIKKIVDSESGINGFLTKVDIHNYYCTNDIPTMLENNEVPVDVLNSKILSLESSLLMQAKNTLILIEDVLSEIQYISKAQFPNNTFISF